METPEVSGLEERIERLETESRRARNALGLLALAALAGFVTLVIWIETHSRDRARFATIEARQIIVDPRTGGPTIRLGADSAGVTRVMVGSDRMDRPGIGFGMAQDRIGQLIAKREHGGAGVTLNADELAFGDSSGHVQTVVGREGRFGFVALSDSARVWRFRVSDLHLGETGSARHSRGQ